MALSRSAKICCLGPQGYSSNEDARMSSTDELDEPHRGSLSTSQPALDRHKRRSLWKTFKKKTNPMRRWNSLRGNSKDRRASADVGGSCLSINPSEQSQDSDSDYTSLPRGSCLSSKNTCHSETDLTMMANGGMKRNKRSTKKKSLSFEDQKLHRKSKGTLENEEAVEISRLEESPQIIRQKLLEIKKSRGSQEATNIAHDSVTDDESLLSPTSVDEGYQPSSISEHDSTPNTNSSANGTMPEMERLGGDLPMTVLPVGEVSQSWRSLLQQYNFFQLDIHLKEGCDLAIRDRSGTSDPYVKFRIAGKTAYKSHIIYKNLNPKWDEKFTLPIDDIHKPLDIFVLDRDRGFASDDPMGSVRIDLLSLEPECLNEKKLELKEAGSVEFLGHILVDFIISPVKKAEDKESIRATSLSKRRKSENPSGSRKVKSQLWNGIITITLLEGKNLIPMDDNGLSDPYIKFKLGSEKYKSKTEKGTLNPKWMEQFDLRLFEDQTNMLEISVWDKDVGSKDDIMGRCQIDIASLKREETHHCDLELEDGAGTLSLLLTITGTAGTESISDLANFKHDPNTVRMLHRKYGILNSLKDLKDVGWLQIKVIKAQGLASADLGGKSDPFCVLELVNSRLQTQTLYKTLNPEWGKVFTFNVKDIHSVLEVTVYDEDKHGSPEFLGKVEIPLLKVKNGERKYYALKDKKLRRRAKGAILLEMDLVFNSVKAAIRTINPREEKYLEQDAKFKVSVLQYNLSRVTRLIGVIIDTTKFINSCFQWESKARSAIAFASYLIIVWNFELYMVPISILLLFGWKYVEVCITEKFTKPVEEDDYVESEDEEEAEKEEKKKRKEGATKTSFKEKLHTIEKVCQTIQNTLDDVACLGERVKNTFNYTVPWLSYMACIVLLIIAVVLYLIPLRYLLLAWGINKFTKKLRKPHAIPNNELLDYLSRIPSDNQLKHYQELRPENLRPDSPKKKR
ncbi:multiple C2 and transmembrane domain-containing protein 2-like isoform X3 [Acanthaster planci]|uniref:Multiple C2 and transmembrane domain-containing protein 2-like isoform X3 n=1 Tax=Acanthaster planci TaxID=133434 RepID=A0A8B7ZQX8_ACAPL|nr:multiple C2 and transmembrane domain-containing protein 2-like isoform X3 [Acanthaster planci]